MAIVVSNTTSLEPKIKANHLLENPIQLRIIKGINFCTVRIINTAIGFKPGRRVITHEWKGGMPSLNSNLIVIIATEIIFSAPSRAAIINNKEASLCLIKYLIALEALVLLFLANRRGITLNMLISKIIHWIIKELTLAEANIQIARSERYNILVLRCLTELQEISYGVFSRHSLFNP